MSPEVYQNLREIPESGFEFLNPVPNPPAQSVTVASPLVFPRGK